MRGSPIRAAFGWALLQEIRLSIEKKFNLGQHDVPQLLRIELLNLLSKHLICAHYIIYYIKIVF